MYTKHGTLKSLKCKIGAIMTLQRADISPKLTGQKSWQGPERNTEDIPQEYYDNLSYSLNLSPKKSKKKKNPED